MNISHHAVLIRSFSVAAALLPPQENTEIQDIYVARFGIDDARELVRVAVQRPAEAEYKLLAVRTEFITHEAQNALLKILEEPPVSTRFIFVLPKDFNLLPTLASRFSEAEGVNVKDEINEQFLEFLKSSYKDRLVAIEQASKKKDLVWQQSIKRGLIKYLEQGEFQSKSLPELEYVARTLLTRGASNKMLLEQVALTLPTR